MLVHGTVPDNFLLSTIVPIPKSYKNSIFKSSNYRGIALSSVLGKVFDKIVLTKFESILKTSPYQYGFKTKHSTSQCTHVVNEVTTILQ